MIGLGTRRKTSVKNKSLILGQKEKLELQRSGETGRMMGIGRVTDKGQCKAQR